MAFTYSPPFVQTPKCTPVALTAALTARDGSGSPTLIDTIGADGGILKRVKFIPAQATAAATTAKVGLLFISIDGGSTLHFLAEVALPTVTPSTTATGETGTKYINFPDGFPLPASAKIYAAITVYAGVQDRTGVIPEYGNY